MWYTLVVWLAGVAYVLAATCDLSKAGDFSSLLDPPDSNPCYENCDKCFTEPEWLSLKKELGLTDEIVAQRQQEWPQGVQAVLPTWASAQLVTQALTILLEEFMGFKTSLHVFSSPQNAMQCIAEGKADLFAEAWYVNTRMQSLGLTQDAFTFSRTGVVGDTGLYIPEYVVEENFCLVSYRAFKMPAFIDYVSPDGTVQCNLQLENSSLTCKLDGTDVFNCGTPEAWGGNVSCYNNRFVPDNCLLPGGAINTACAEVLMAYPSYSARWWESVVKNLGLNFTLTYLGTNLEAEVVRRAKAKIPQIFYTYEPHTLLSQVPATMISIPKYTDECKATENSDLTKSGINCHERQEPIYKIHNKRTARASPDLQAFFTDISFQNSNIQSLLSFHSAGGGSLNARGAACAWLKNTTSWKSWIRNTPKEKEVSSSSLIMIIVVLAVVIVIGIISGVCIYLYLKKTKLARVLQSVPSDFVSIMFTDIQGSTSLWDEYPKDMSYALDLHNLAIRLELQKYGGYEVKTVGDCFMVAFQTSNQALECAFEIQRKLLTLEWPKDLLYHDACQTLYDADGKLIWKGLRVRMGIHYGCPELEPDAQTMKVDYMGPPVNMAARVEGSAVGGQIVVTGAFVDSLDDSVKYHRESLGEKALKGIKEPEELFSVLPTELAKRKFEERKDTPACIDCGGELSCVTCEAKLEAQISGHKQVGRKSTRVPNVRPASVVHQLGNGSLHVRQFSPSSRDTKFYFTDV